MATSRKIMLASICLALFSKHVDAATVSGIVVRTEGRADNLCRYVIVKKTDGTTVLLRIPSGAGSEGIMAAALTALATGKPVEADYSTASMCGGTELSINSLAVLS